MSNTQQTSAPRVPTVLRLSGLNLEQLAQRLSEWGTGLVQLLSGNLRLGVHAACQVVTFTITTDGSGAGSATVQTRFSSRPVGILLMQCQDQDGSPVQIPEFSWTWGSGSATISILEDTDVSPVTLTALIVLG